MKVYVFGNKDSELDDKVFAVAKRLRKSFPKLEFVEIEPNADLPFSPNEHVYILDTVEGIPEPILIKNDGLDKLVSKTSTSVHDFDLGFQLKYLKKLNKLGYVTIIGIPMKAPIDYLRIHSIFKKLVAQDMQGS